MQADGRMHGAAGARTSAADARRPLGRAHSVRSRSCLPRRRCSAPLLVGGAHAVVALLLLLLLPLGLVHRSSTGACRYDHRVAVAAGAAHDVGVDAPAAASAGHERVLAVDQHDHRASGPPLDGAAPGACGPAILVAHSAAPSAAPYRSVLPEWRALSPLALAPPPPEPPPRLS